MGRRTDWQIITIRFTPDSDIPERFRNISRETGLPYHRILEMAVVELEKNKTNHGEITEADNLLARVEKLESIVEELAANIKECLIRVTHESNTDINIPHITHEHNTLEDVTRVAHEPNTELYIPRITHVSNTDEDVIQVTHKSNTDEGLTDITQVYNTATEETESVTRDTQEINIKEELSQVTYEHNTNDKLTHITHEDNTVTEESGSVTREIYVSNTEERPTGIKHVSITSEYKINQRIMELKAEGLSIGAIAKTLTAEGIPTPSGGKKWQARAVSDILKKIDDNKFGKELF